MLTTLLAKCLIKAAFVFLGGGGVFSLFQNNNSVSPERVAVV